MIQMEVKMMSAVDLELAAMGKLVEALEGLDDEQRGRVIAWVASRYGVSTTVKGRKSVTTEGEVEENGEKGFSDLPALMSAAVAKTGAQRALLVGYWHQVLQGHGDFESFAINKELKNLGHGLANVTKTLGDLMKQKPQQVIQTHKKGAGQQGRKRYRLTDAGIAAAKRLLSGGATEEE
jgi:hypothetical protein